MKQNEKQDKKMFVSYVGIGSIDNDTQINKILTEAYRSLKPIFETYDEDCECIFIPTRSNDSRIECIDPKYITDQELVRKHRLLMDELHEHLDIKLKEIEKDFNNE